MCINAYLGELNELQEDVQLEVYSQILIPGLPAHTSAHTDPTLDTFELPRQGFTQGFTQSHGHLSCSREQL